MNISKKSMISAGWIVVFILACLSISVLRTIGTTWMNELGFVRVLVLLGLVVGTIVPLTLAVLVWFDIPKNLYKKLR